ncbi:MAG: hypothetical protein M3436_19985 [Pseudomonadota bacterium]|nr:hypothetical protein [Pseudomonadota bacterium]
MANKQCTFVFDTAAGRIALDPSILQGKLREIGPFTLHDGRIDPKNGTLYELPEIKVQALTVQKAKGFLYKFEGLSAGFGQQLSGILGLSDLGAVKILLDYQNSAVVIHRSAWRLDSADVTEVGLRNDASRGSFDTEHASFETEIEGEPCAFTVDSGDNGCVEVPFTLFDRFVEAGVIKVAERPGRTLSALGITRNKRGWFLKGRLMGRELTGVSVTTSSQLGLLGLGWLCGFQTEIDLTARKLRYRAIEHPRPPISVQRMLGAILLYRDGRQVIESLQPDAVGPAERAGMKAGDIIHQFGSLVDNGITGTKVIEVVAANAGGRIPVKLYRPEGAQWLEVTLEIPEMISDWDFAGLPDRPPR